MENSADKYLHKKFKKQLSIEQKIQNNDKEAKAVLPIISSSAAATITDEPQNNNVVRSSETFSEIRTNCQQTSTTTTSTVTTTAEQCYKVAVKRNTTPPRKDNNNESVPNQSTNQNSLSALNTSSYYASSYVKSSISPKQEVDEIVSCKNNDVTTIMTTTTPTNSQQSANTCISYVITSSKPTSRLVNLNQQPETTTFRPVNFDTKFNNSSNNNNNNQQSEPSSNNNPLVVVETSSILDNTPTKTYVTSKLVKIEKEDISSDWKNNLVSTTFDEHSSGGYVEKQVERKTDGQDNPSVPDKSSGGKYVCTYCNLACSKPSVLQKHIRAHTNERPYPCVSCGFSFKTRSNLYKHCRSRTHANRVMGNKAQEINNEMEVDVHNQHNEMSSQDEQYKLHSESNRDYQQQQQERNVLDAKPKPYKPRFHTTKAFFDSMPKENYKDDNEKSAIESPHISKHAANSDLLSIHINELINKNYSIVNSSDPYLLKKRSTDYSTSIDNVNNKDNLYSHNADEPLNLTNKNRKRSLSEVGSEPSTQKSLIKELLLKNLYADSNMQCRYCKMIFQTVTEFELHKLRACRGANKTGLRYSRSSSVNVASILTQNKNAFDGIPRFQNTVFPLKSPGPFLGNTRLVESDKNKSFSFDDVLPTSSNDLVKTSHHYSLSPLTLQYDGSRERKPPVRLFGGEVKITHTSGETKSYKIDNKETDRYETKNYVDYDGGKLSENRVVKTSLQSGGTVLTSTPNYYKQTSLGQSQDIMRVYDCAGVSPNVINLEKTKFNFDKPEIVIEQHRRSNEIASKTSTDTTTTFNNSTPYKYTDIMDFSQKAAKLLAPNLKQLNLTIPGVPVPSKHFSHSPIPLAEAKLSDRDLVDFAQKQISLQQKMASETPSTSQQNLYNPMNLIVNGKVVRYVPGIPGPVAAEAPLDMAFTSSIISTARLPSSPLHMQQSPVQQKPVVIVENVNNTNVNQTLPSNKPVIQETNKMLHVQTEKNPPPNKSPKIDETTMEVKTIVSPKPSVSEMKSPKICEVTSSLSTVVSSKSSLAETPRKFARPNSLALKPSMAAIKQHHGLTPTMFNQILISPDTPRIAKKYMHHFLHGNYFSYLGLKSSTKPVYCTLNKTQPFYVPHFKKLSMYSEWRQQDNKTDKLYGSAYDSRQKQQKYTTAGKTTADLIVHSSYKFVVTESANKNDDQKGGSILGGYECNDDYTYIRGRGRGRYVCDQCGIRCKKPSMLKKHIRTHSNDRPYTCSHCNFSFKTKGNLTKHMKSKAHTKNYAASSGSSTSSNQQSGTQSSESETEDSGMDSSDESTTRQQEHEAAYGLLSLSQKTNSNGAIINSQIDNQNSPPPVDASIHFMNTEQIAYVTKTNFAKNKILDQQTSINFSGPKNIIDLIPIEEEYSQEMQNLTQFLGKSNTNRPLTYPYTVIVSTESKTKVDYADSGGKLNNPMKTSVEQKNEPKSIKQFHVIQRYNVAETTPKNTLYDNMAVEQLKNNQEVTMQQHVSNVPSPIIKINDKVIFNENSDNVVTDLRKRKMSLTDNVGIKIKMRKNDEVIDLSMPVSTERINSPEKYNGMNEDVNYIENLHPNAMIKKKFDKAHHTYKKNYNQLENVNKNHYVNEDDLKKLNNFYENDDNLLFIKPPIQIEENNRVNINYVIQEHQPSILPIENFKTVEYDNSAMETLADIATKQVKLEKNTLAKSVASEYLKLATKNEFVTNDGSMDSTTFVSTNKDVNDLIVKPEENKSCTICSKNFNKPSQLRLHMNIHYLERPFRCDSCSVSFRTKGHLQKHERSASHHNKLSSSPALSSSEPRPFKCSDCNIAFRIHGHLAKHLRSKMHIMKLECLAKIPFGLYAELERSNSLLTEINTTDGDQCLESLKTLAKKVFINDPSKLNQIEEDS